MLTPGPNYLTVYAKAGGIDAAMKEFSFYVLSCVGSYSPSDTPPDSVFTLQSGLSRSNPINPSTGAEYDCLSTLAVDDNAGNYEYPEFKITKPGGFFYVDLEISQGTDLSKFDKKFTLTFTHAGASVSF